VKFWDSSALVPLIVSEAATPAVLAELAADSEVLVWWGTPVECVSAISRREREGDLEPEQTSIALRRLAAVQAAWSEVQPSDRVRATAIRVLRTHPLRGTDSLQLAAALAAAEDHPATLPLVTFDDRLADAAEREGFPIVRPGQGRMGG
jgi:predicted nucleic acid-binding protein